MQDLHDRMSLDLGEECSKISSQIRFLVIHGTEDETIPVEDGHSIASALPTAKLVIIEGGDHSFTNPEHGNTVVKEAVAFLTKQ